MNELPAEWTDDILKILLVDSTPKQDSEEWISWLNQLDRENQNESYCSIGAS